MNLGGMSIAMWKGGLHSSFTTLSETPRAELPVRGLGAECCVGWELETPGYPIRLISKLLSDVLLNRQKKSFYEYYCSWKNNNT